MEVFKTLKPGEPGTKRLCREYGDQLVNVRYRKGTDPNRIYTTVEIIVDSRIYHPGLTHAPVASKRETQRFPIWVKFDEVELRQKVKEAGGKWDMGKKVWYLSYKKIAELNLKNRITNI